MIVKLNAISFKDESFHLTSEDFKGFPLPYPLLETKGGEATITLKKKRDGTFLLGYHLSLAVVASDRRDASSFPYQIEKDGEVLLLRKEDGEHDGYIVSEDEFNAGALLLRIWTSDLEFGLEHPGAAINYDGVDVYSEDDYTKQEN